jgi:hypothetical protein
MSSKIYVSKIVRDHWRTLRANDRVSRPDILVFYVLPIVCGCMFAYFKKTYDANLLVQLDNVVVAAFSIFGALLFSVQVLIIGLMERHRSQEPHRQRARSEKQSAEDVVFETKSRDLRDRALKELFANISYCILVAIVMVAFALALIFTEIHGIILMKAVQLATGLHFLLTCTMVLKRMHVVFDGRMS